MGVIFLNSFLYLLKDLFPTFFYVIESDTENQLLVLLEEDEFYYYSPDNKVFLLKNLGKAPARLNQN